jgi:hypothetical protein
MQEAKEIELLGGVNLKHLGTWLGISRNRVKEFMDGLGVSTADKKYPWRRVIESVLAVAPNSVNVNLTEKPLMTLAEAAEELGERADGFKDKILAGDLRLPPVYVFGPKRSRFIHAQLIECSRNPRSAFTEFPLREELFLTVEQVANAMCRSVEDLAAEFRIRDVEEPKHVILSGGEKRYFKADVQRLGLLNSGEQLNSSPADSPTFSGGVLGVVARSASKCAHV